VDKRQKVEDKIRAHQEKLVSKELKKCTFRPKINDYKVLAPDGSSFFLNEDFSVLDSPSDR
jgi:hypothetical protein